MSQILVEWYRALRRFHSCRDALNIARRMEKLEIPLAVVVQWVRHADCEHILRTARVDYTPK